MDKEIYGKVCHCGSGLWSEMQFDGRGIPLSRTCPECHKKTMAKYSKHILEYYTQADVDEPIEPED